MPYDTVRFGPIEYREEDVIAIPAGIIPFVSATRFALLSSEDEWPFSWLQSLDDAALAFVVAPLGAVFPEHAASALRGSPRDGLDETEDSRSVLGIVVLDADPSNITINLLAPIVVNFDEMRAEQVVLDGPLELAREPLEPALRALAAA